MNIEKFTLIKRQDLDEGAYFESLMEKALELKLITDNAIEAIQDECLNLLAQNIRRAYGDMSDSVSEKRAESMMDSIIYTLGVGLKTFVYPDEALDFLLKNGVDALYLRGVKRINEMLLGIREMLDILQNTLKPNADVLLICTVTKILPTFLKKYNPEIAAHERVVIPIYPISLNIDNYDGIEYIFAYTAALLRK